MQAKDKFDYVIVETTGLADPGPVASAFWLDEGLGGELFLDAIVTVVDARNCGAQLDGEHEQAAKQVACADVILLNKTDLEPEASLDALQARLTTINPTAPVYRCAPRAAPSRCRCVASRPGRRHALCPPCAWERTKRVPMPRRSVRCPHLSPRPVLPRIHSAAAAPTPARCGPSSHWTRCSTSVRSTGSRRGGGTRRSAWTRWRAQRRGRRGGAALEVGVPSCRCVVVRARMGLQGPSCAGCAWVFSSSACHDTHPDTHPDKHRDVHTERHTDAYAGRLHGDAGAGAGHGQSPHAHAQPSDADAHDATRVRSVVVRATSPVDVAALTRWIGSLLWEGRGRDVYRIKGVIAAANSDDLHVLQGVHECGASPPRVGAIEQWLANRLRCARWPRRPPHRGGAFSSLLSTPSSHVAVACPRSALALTREPRHPAQLVRRAARTRVAARRGARHQDCRDWQTARPRGAAGRSQRLLRGGRRRRPRPRRWVRSCCGADMTRRDGYCRTCLK